MTGATLVGTHSVPTSGDDQEGLAGWPTLYSVDDSPEEQRLRAISARRKRLAAQIKALRAEERDAILAAHKTGSKQVKLCNITGFTRDYVRRVTNPELTPSGRRAADSAADSA